MSGPAASPENNKKSPCNGTGITTDSILNDDGNKFLVKDQEEKSAAQGLTESKISYGALERPPLCDANQYGKCIVPIGPYNRPCNDYNRCGRSSDKKSSTF